MATAMEDDGLVWVKFKKGLAFVRVWAATHSEIDEIEEDSAGLPGSDLELFIVDLGEGFKKFFGEKLTIHRSDSKSGFIRFARYILNTLKICPNGNRRRNYN
jgi:hypothetical protein